MSEFDSMPNRLWGELERRLEAAKRRLKYHHGFLDDILRGVYVHDLVLIGAPTGVGKTQLALGIAANNAWSGKRVALFSLEAERDEMERRSKYARIAMRMYRDRHAQAELMNYPDWLAGDCEEFCGHLNQEVDEEIGQSLSLLHTYYRGEKFDQSTLTEQVLKAAVWADLIVIDHLHYIDLDAGQSEVTGYGEVVKTVRDLALRTGKPVIVIAHLRKKDKAERKIVAELDDFHGSSNITKICTQVIALAPAAGIVKPDKWYLAPTFVSVLKDRREGSKRLVALCQYDQRLQAYASSYTLGVPGKDGKPWSPIGMTAPRWAKNHVNANIELEGKP